MVCVIAVWYYRQLFNVLDTFFIFKQKTAYEIRISDWSSDVCSSDLAAGIAGCSSSAGAAAPVSRGVGGTDADSATGPVAGRESVAARGLPGEPGPDSGADAGFACGATPEIGRAHV